MEKIGKSHTKVQKNRIIAFLFLQIPLKYRIGVFRLKKRSEQDDFKSDITGYY